MAFDFKNVFSSLSGETDSVPSKVVGIDFGAASIKVVELEKREEVITLSSYGELQLGPYGGVEMGQPTALEMPKKIEAIVDVFRESNIKSKSGVMALPLTSSFVTVIKVQTETVKEDIGTRVKIEAKKYIPVPVTDVVLDWNEISFKLDGNTGKVHHEVLIAAVQTEVLNNTRELLSAVSMLSEPSEIEVFSTIRAINKVSDEILAVVDLGARTSKMYIAEEGRLRKIHRAHFGGTHATEKISEMLGISFVDAENMKRSYATVVGNKNPDIKKAFVTSFERPFQEFRRVLDQYEIEKGFKINRLVLCGGSAAFSEMPAFASYMFDREVVRANPFSKVAYPAFMEDTLTEIAPTFTTALGCALRPYEIND